MSHHYSELSARPDEIVRAFEGVYCRVSLDEAGALALVLRGADMPRVADVIELLVGDIRHLIANRLQGEKASHVILSKFADLQRRLEACRCPAPRLSPAEWR